MKKFFVTVAACFLTTSIYSYAHAQQGQKLSTSEILGERREYYFDDNKPSELPVGFQNAFTGKGEPGRWVVKKIEHAPSADNVVEQTKLDDTDYRFPLLVLDGVSYKDFMAFVRFRAEGGKIDQAGGLVFRYKDNNNYYVLRANALENNVRLYTVINGNRRQIDGKDTRVTPKEWHLLKVICKADKIQCFFENTKVIEVSDNTFDSGSVGLWTKSDSYTYFDDLVIQESK
ncbi:MAG: DUF1080 domain-containing protein [Planctomycetes bacterium]|uniref:family 16 glycoside hydrolase n=1 Tax=Candidatus Wunengus californicus TaxID=3367619 RepID=UPI004025503E|nr:DUF1080 domain-containing protein [Planctomycetota bacterium]MBI4222515.1 DUF1080 domain-containing protein [Planctomycetota bacterium]